MADIILHRVMKITTESDTLESGAVYQTLTVTGEDNKVLATITAFMKGARA